MRKIILLFVFVTIIIQIQAQKKNYTEGPLVNRSVHDTLVCGTYTCGDSTYTPRTPYDQPQICICGDDTLSFKLYPWFTTDITRNACTAYTWTDGTGETYTVSGDYEFGYVTQNGCFVDILHVTIFNKRMDTTVCESFEWHDSTYTEEGVHLFGYQLDEDCYNDCNCIDTLVLTIGTHSIDEMATVCEYESYEWVGHDTVIGPFDHAETVRTFVIWDSLKTATYGCDSVYKLTLTVTPSYLIEEIDTVCANMEYTWFGHHNDIVIGPFSSDTVIRTYTFWDSLKTAAYDCDSVYKLTLMVAPSYFMEENDTICQHTNYKWKGHYNDELFPVFDNAGTYIFWDSLKTDIFECDSVYKLELVVMPINVVQEVDTCESFTWFVSDTSMTYTESGIYTYEYLNAAECVSVDTLKLTIYYGTHNMTDTSECEVYVHTWPDGNSSTYTESGVYTHNYDNTHGCASVDTLHLTILHGTHNVLSTAICEGESFEWNGSMYTVESIYTYDYENEDGCASVDTLKLTVNENPPVYAIEGDGVICQNQYVVYTYPEIDSSTYHYAWSIQDSLVGENLSEIMYYAPLNDTNFVISIAVMEWETGCVSDTSFAVSVCEYVSPDPTQVIRKPNSNMLICQTVASSSGTVHYKWGYTEKASGNEMAFTWDHPYYQYDQALNTDLYDYWVEVYVVHGSVICSNRTYYVVDNPTDIADYGDNFNVIVYRQNGQCHLRIHNAEMHNVSGGLYDISGKLLQQVDFGRSPIVEQQLDYAYASGVYILILYADGKCYTTKIAW